MSPLCTPSARRALIAALAAALALLAVPGVASAADVFVDGTRLVYQAADGEENTPSVALRYDTTTQYDIHDYSSDLVPGPGCVQSDNPYSRPHHVICTVPGLAEINVDLGDGDDSYDGYSSIAASVVTTVDLGAGMNSVDDQAGGEDNSAVSNIIGGSGPDDISTYGGDDFVDAGGGNDDVSTGDGEDEIHLGPGVEDYAFGGDGDDRMWGDAGKDSLRGSGGDDEIHGGDGNDDLRGEDGVDELHGDGGDDELAEDYSGAEYASGETVSGGPGTDTATYSGYARSNGTTLAISLDGQPNDGQDDDQDGIAEEGDNIGPAGDIEIVVGGDGDDYLEGSDRSETLDAGWGDDIIAGLGGDDELLAGVGDDLVLGGFGNDDIDGSSGKDRLLGEEGDDSLEGSTGDDGIDGGSGIDTIDAGGDNDVVLAQDGEVDQIGCGIGGDVAEVDFFDVVNADPGSLCETVRSTTAPTGGGTPTTPAGQPTVPQTNAGTGNPNAGLVTGVAVPLGQTLAGVLRTGVFRMEGTAPGAGTFDVKAFVSRLTARKAKIAAKKWVKVGSGRATASAAGKFTIPVKLTSKARKQLKKKKRKIKSVSLRTVTKFKAADGTVWKSTKTVLLKR